jgi:hypothetical protein
MTKNPAFKIDVLLDRACDIMMQEVDIIATNIRKVLIENPDASAAVHSMRISAESFEFYGCPSYAWRDHDHYDGVAFYHDFEDADTLAWVHDVLVKHRMEIGQLLLLCAIHPGGQALRLKDSRLGRRLLDPAVRIRLLEKRDLVSDSLYRLAQRRRKHKLRRQLQSLMDQCSANPKGRIGKEYLHICGDGLALSDLPYTETAGMSIRVGSWMKGDVFRSVVLDEAALSLADVIEWACFADPKRIPQIEAYRLADAFEYPRCEPPF